VARGFVAAYSRSCVTASSVLTVARFWAEARESRATSMELSTARAEYRKVPTICWSRGTRVGDIQGESSESDIIGDSGP
jgi:hypothetical protein